MTLTLDITRSDKPVGMMDSLTRLISFALFPSTHLISTLLLLLNYYKMAPTIQLIERDASCPGGVSFTLFYSSRWLADE